VKSELKQTLSIEIGKRENFFLNRIAKERLGDVRGDKDREDEYEFCRELIIATDKLI